MNKIKIKLPNGYSLESTDAANVPDVTAGAGENVMEAQAEQQKPVTDDAAEYDAAHEADTAAETENVQKEASVESLIALMNQDTFYGLSIMQRARKSGEAFGISKAFRKMVFSSVEEAIKHPEIKQAISVAEEWANNKGYSIASVDDVNRNKMTLATMLFRRAGEEKRRANLKQAAGFDQNKHHAENKFKIYKANGAAIIAIPGIWSTLGDLATAGYKQSRTMILYICFKKGNDKIIVKRLAAYKTQSSFATESYGIFAGLMSRESEDQTPDGAEKPETSDTVPPVTTTDEVDGSTTTPPAAAAEEEEDDSVNISEEIDHADGTDDAGNGNGDGVEDKTSTSTPESGDDTGASEEEKAVEAFFKQWSM